MEQHVQSPEVGGRLHSYSPKPEGWVGTRARTQEARGHQFNSWSGPSTGAESASAGITGGFGAGDCGFQFWKCPRLHLGSRRTPSEGGLRAWARLRDWLWYEREGQIQEPWKRKTWGVLWAGPRGWHGCPAGLPGCPPDCPALGPAPCPPPWRTCPSLLLSPELLSEQHAVSPPSPGAKLPREGGRRWGAYLTAPLGSQGSPTPGEGHTGATGDHSAPWPGCLGPAALSRVRLLCGWPGLGLGQEG